MTIKELKNKWKREKEAYKTQEVGSGVEAFVKDVLLSEEIFGLKKGLKSTPLEKRRNEFLEEEKTREKRKADIVIYISPEIVIPVEVERYQNIEAGANQILKYQTDLDKKYGILTDGFTWRFYTNNVFREFTLDKILDETEKFLEFWKEYIKPENYYLLFFEPLGQLQLFEEKLPVENYRQMFFEDITKLIKSFKNKLQIEGYLNHIPDKKAKEKMAVELTYAYVIQFILYKTLVDNEFGEFKENFEKVVKAIHKNLKEKRFKEILGIIDGISAQISENIYRPFKKEQEVIRRKLLKIFQDLENKLSDVSPWLDIFVFIKKYNFANIENEIFGYIYENYLKEIYEEERKGQYFTDPAVVNFMLQQIGFTPEEIKKRYEKDKNSISLIDPACGSGTFLYSAVNQIIKAFGNHTKEKTEEIKEIVSKNIFGLDIAEFPLYLAEMNIVMRMLPLIINEKYNNPIEKKIKVFLTKDSVAEFLNTALRNTLHDIDVKGGQLSWNFKDLDLGYRSYVREEGDLEEMKKSLEAQPEIPRRRFDYVIGNPPYVSYNECSKQKVLIFELMKQGKASLNNIYGVNLHSIPNNRKKYAPKPNLYAFFIALGIALLKDNGKLCYIIPQTILVNPDLDVIRYHLSKFTTIEKIITFSGKMFIGRGLRQNKPVPTSSLIFVLNRKMPSPLHQVEIINYKDSNDTIEEVLQNILIGKKSKKIEKKKILQNKLFQNVTNWNFIKQPKKFLDFYEEYQRNTDDISIYYNHILAEQKFKGKFYFDGSTNIPKKEIFKKVPVDFDNYYVIPELKSKGYLANICGYFPKNKKIKIAQGSQGLVVAEPMYKILWRYINFDKFYFLKGSYVLPIYQQYCITSNNASEIYYLFAILNSKIISLVLKTFLKVQHEDKLSFLLGLTSIKEYVRVPKITQDNQKIKDEIIKRTEEMLALEEKKLSDFVDFSKVMLQKFDRVYVEGNNLILEREDKKIKLAIKENQRLIEKVINEKYGKKLIKSDEEKVTLSELKALPIIDYEKQREIKNYIDDLVFALYFNIRLEKLGLNQAQEIKAKCLRNPYYELVNTQNLS